MNKDSVEKVIEEFKEKWYPNSSKGAWVMSLPAQKRQIGHLRELLTSLLQSEVERLEKEKQKKPKGKCLNAENHLFGSCFECKKIDGHNTAKDEEIQHYQNLIKELNG